MLTAHCVVAAGREDAKLQSNYSDSHVAVSVANNIIYTYIYVYLFMYVFMHVPNFLKELPRSVFGPETRSAWH